MTFIFIYTLVCIISSSFVLQILRFTSQDIRLDLKAFITVEYTYIAKQVLAKLLTTNIEFDGLNKVLSASN